MWDCVWSSARPPAACLSCVRPYVQKQLSQWCGGYKYGACMAMRVRVRCAQRRGKTRVIYAERGARPPPPLPLPLSLFFFSLFCRRAGANTINSLWFTFMCLCIVDENVHTPESSAGPPQHSHNVLALCDVAVVRVEGPAAHCSRSSASHALQKYKCTHSVNFLFPFPRWRFRSRQ
jgi:hypothetical protein